MIWGECTSPRT